MREMEKLGVETRMVASIEFDPFNMIDAKWKHDYRGHSKVYLIRDILKESLWADIVHVHSMDKVVAPLKMLRRRVLLHYHGTDIRGRWAEMRGRWSYADRIIVSTRNLLEGAPPDAEYIQNPVDTELFKPLGGARARAALHFNYGAVDLAEQIAREYGLPIVVREKGVPYRDLPAVMNGYTHYIDVKRDDQGRLLMGKPDDTGSLIGLQARACGLTLLTLNGSRGALPWEHRPEVAAARIYEIYKEMMK